MPNLLDPADIGRPVTGPTLGRTWVRSGAAPAAYSLLGWSHLFTGRTWDPDVRQYYFRHRWYDPHQARWTALDPIGYSGGIDQYAYCGGNPVCFVDPLGLSFGGDCVDDFKAGIGPGLDLLDAGTAPGIAANPGLAPVATMVGGAGMMIGSAASAVSSGGAATPVALYGMAYGSATVGLGVQQYIDALNGVPSAIPSLPGQAMQQAAPNSVGMSVAGTVVDMGGVLVGGLQALEAAAPTAVVSRTAAGAGKAAETCPKLTRPVSELRAAGLKDAHHVYQDAAVRDIPGYISGEAPGVQLLGPSTTKGTAHYLATQVQRQSGGGTLAAERRIAFKALRAGGFDHAQARQAIGEADAYFRGLGTTNATATRIPRNR